MTVLRPYIKLVVMKSFRSVVLGAALGAVAMLAVAQNARTERMNHPRISAAITELRGAVAYLEAAPHDFGGHKAAALQSSRAAIRDLNLALQYRAKEDRGR